MTRMLPEGAVVFLFNHDAAHQLFHTVGVMRALAMLRTGLPVVCAYAGENIRASLAAVVGDEALHLIKWFDLALSRPLTAVTTLGDALFPAGRVARLEYHASVLRTAALIVSPERTCLHLKRKWDGVGPRFVFVPHGSGDRGVTYHRALGNFDAMLVGGRKVADEMIAHGLATPATVRVIGYPKFDLIDANRQPRFFDNSKTTVLYNPHFEPGLSSWFDHGPALLDWFARPGNPFNLIFAPHVMLFRKPIHVSLDLRTARFRPRLRQEWLEASNILIDTESPRLFDMSYTLAADFYLGDVSSQIYEFLIRPRPCAFFEPRSRRADVPDGGYLFWRAGDVAGNADEMIALLPKLLQRWPQFRQDQAEIFSYTMSREAKPSSQRGAEAIIDLLAQWGAKGFGGGSLTRGVDRKLARPVKEIS